MRLSLHLGKDLRVGLGNVNGDLARVSWMPLIDGQVRDVLLGHVLREGWIEGNSRMQCIDIDK